MRLRYSLLACPLASLLCAEEPGWKVGGHLELGAGVIQHSSALSTKDTQQITSLEHSAESATQAIPVVGFLLKATPPASSFSYVLKDRRYMAIEAGIEHQAAPWRTELGIYTPLRTQQVWQNPYDTAAPRVATDKQSWGSELSVGRYESQYQFVKASYRHEREDVDLDALESLSSDLARSATTQEGRIDLGVGFMVLGAHYTLHEAKGDAESYDAPGISAGIGGNHPQWSWRLRGELSSREYRKSHPYFGKERDEMVTSLLGTVRWQKPFSWERSYLFFSLLHTQTDSNIPFFDAQMLAGGMGVGMRY